MTKVDIMDGAGGRLGTLARLAICCFLIAVSVTCGSSGPTGGPAGAKRFTIAGKPVSGATCSDSSYPTACGAWCCATGSTCTAQGCACAGDNPVACGENCCLAGGACNGYLQDCSCPSGWTECGHSAYCCSPDQVCENLGCKPKAGTGGADAG